MKPSHLPRGRRRTRSRRNRWYCPGAASPFESLSDLRNSAEYLASVHFLVDLGAGSTQHLVGNRRNSPTQALGLTGERHKQVAGVCGLDQQRPLPTESCSPCRWRHPIFNYQFRGPVQVLGTEENLE